MHYHAHKSPEQAAEHRRNTSAGMDRWHAGRTEAEREHARQLQTDAAVCRMFTAHTPGIKFQKGRGPVGNTTPDALERRTLTRVQTASIKRILKDIVGTRPELVYNAIIAGLLASPPRSVPYLILAATYLDGRPGDAEPPVDNREELSNLTSDQLLARAVAVTQRLKDAADERAALAKERAERATASGLPIIDATVVPE